MRNVFLVPICVLLFACGSRPEKIRSEQQDPNPVPCGGAALSSMEVSVNCLNPTIIKFKSPDGHEYVSLGNVTSVDIALTELTGGTGESLSRSFSGDHTRVLTIQNGRLLEDKSYPDVTYNPGKTLDWEWLAKQPT